MKSVWLIFNSNHTFFVTQNAQKYIYLQQQKWKSEQNGCSPLYGITKRWFFWCLQAVWQKCAQNKMFKLFFLIAQNYTMLGITKKTVKPVCLAHINLIWLFKDWTNITQSPRLAVWDREPSANFVKGLEEATKTTKLLQVCDFVSNFPLVCSVCTGGQCQVQDILIL